MTDPAGIWLCFSAAALTRNQTLQAVV